MVTWGAVTFRGCHLLLALQLEASDIRDKQLCQSEALEDFNGKAMGGLLALGTFL